MSEAAVSVRNLSFAFGQRTILDKISFELNAGTTYALMGKNGCGKTTLIRCMVGALKADVGKIFIDGRNAGELSRQELGRKVAYVPQSASAGNSFRVIDYLAFGRTPYLAWYETPKHADYDLVRKYAKSFLPESTLSKRIDQVSGGEWQLINIVRALVQETDFIIMDEPAASLDISNQALLLNAIKKLGDENKTVLFSTHDPNHPLMVNCQAIIMNDGKIAAMGAAKEVITQETIQAVYGVGVYIGETGGKRYCFLEI